MVYFAEAATSHSSLLRVSMLRTLAPQLKLHLSFLSHTQMYVPRSSSYRIKIDSSFCHHHPCLRKKPCSLGSQTTLRKPTLWRSRGWSEDSTLKTQGLNDTLQGRVRGAHLPFQALPSAWELFWTSVPWEEKHSTTHTKMSQQTQKQFAMTLSQPLYNRRNVHDHEFHLLSTCIKCQALYYVVHVHYCIKYNLPR